MSFFCFIFNFITSIKKLLLLFEPDGNRCYEKKCYRCNRTFHRCRDLKNHHFLSHCQSGGQLPVENKPLNILKRSNFLTSFSINFDQHQDFYIFFDSEKLVDDFLSVLELKSLPTENEEVQGTFSLINFQPDESEYLVEIIDKRSLITDVYDCIFFNKYVKRGLTRDMLKRVAVNGLTGNNWIFKRFHRLVISIKNKDLTTVRI